MSGRALSFGTVAAAYERFRPGYPASVFDTVMAYVSRELEWIRVETDRLGQRR